MDAFQRSVWEWEIFRYNDDRKGVCHRLSSNTMEGKIIINKRILRCFFQQGKVIISVTSLNEPLTAMLPAIMPTSTAYPMNMCLSSHNYTLYTFDSYIVLTSISYLNGSFYSIKLSTKPFKGIGFKRSRGVSLAERKQTCFLLKYFWVKLKH